jgi:hypothetical protein
MITINTFQKESEKRTWEPEVEELKCRKNWPGQWAGSRERPIHHPIPAQRLSLFGSRPGGARSMKPVSIISEGLIEDLRLNFGLVKKSMA